MIIQVFAIKDRATNAFMQPFFAQTIGAAARAFADSVNDGSTPMNKHPDDYDLWHLGQWNDETGAFHVQTPEQISIGKNVSTSRPNGTGNSQFPPSI